MNSRQVLLAHYMNQAISAIKDLVAAAANGSTLSEQLLRYTADDLLRASGDARIANLKRAVEQGKPRGRLK